MNKKFIKRALLSSLFVLNITHGHAFTGTAAINESTLPKPVFGYTKMLTLSGAPLEKVLQDIEQPGWLVKKNDSTKIAYYTTGMAPCMAVAFYDKQNHNSAFTHFSNNTPDGYDINDINKKFAVITNIDFNPNSTTILISPGTTADPKGVDGIKKWAQEHKYTNVKIVPPLQNTKGGQNSAVFYIDGNGAATLYGVGSSNTATKFYYNGATSISNLTGVANTGVIPF